MHDCEAPAGEAMAARPGEYYEVVDVRPRGSYSRRVRLAATVACAGALLAATAANVGGGGGAAVALSQRETVMVTVPRGVRAGQLFDFDVPGRGEFSAAVPEGAGPGDNVELEVAGKGKPISSLLQRPLQEAERAGRAGPTGIHHEMFKAVVPRSALLDGRFTVEVPGKGEVAVMLPAGKQPGDTIEFPLPPPDVKLHMDRRPRLARVVARSPPPAAVAPVQQPEARQAPAGPLQPRSVAPPPQQQQAQEVRVEVPAGASGGEILVVQGSGGGEFEVTVPAGAEPGSTFLAMLPAEPAAAPALTKQPAALLAPTKGRTMALEGLSDAVTSAVTDAVQGAVQEAAKEEEVKEEATRAAAPPPAPVPAPAEAPAVEAAPAPAPPPAEEPASAAVDEPESRTAAAAGAEAPPAEATPVAAAEGMGHRDAEAAFNEGEPIVAQVCLRVRVRVRVLVRGRYPETRHPKP